jgi:hypothetical protein
VLTGGFLLLTAALLQPHFALAVGCGDYLTQAQAQARLRADPSDPEGLDPDNNGIACDRNPQPYDRTPVPRPGAATATPTPPATPTPEATKEAPPEESPPPEPTAAPAPRSPLLGPVPPPLMYLQGGAAPPYVNGSSAQSGETASAGGIANVQGADSTIGAVVMQRALGVIQPPNTGDGGLLEK